MKMRFGLLIIIVVLLSGCSGLSSTEDVNKSLITEMLEDIRIAFILADLNAIMSHYHSDYFHNGDFFADEEVKWESRLIEYSEIDITDLDIDISGNFAVASFNLDLISENGSSLYQEPSAENGDLSYLYYENGEWQIFGNQQDIDQLPQ